MALVAGAVLVMMPYDAHGQLTLAAARQAAQRASPELRAAREAVTAATARTRQAGALINPTLTYGREQTSRAGQTNAQDIAQVEQRLEVGGQRGARREVARFRVEGAEARLAAVAAEVHFSVTRAFVLAVAAEQRVRLAEQATSSFAEAQRVSDQRLAAGDVSGYVARRLRLEGARVAAARAAAVLDRHAARTALASLMGHSAAWADSLALPTELPDAVGDLPGFSLDALLARSAGRPELRVVALDAETAMAEARLAARERIPTPTFSAGYKGERVADSTRGSQPGFRGIVAGLSIPLPLFDRRAGAIEAAEADARRVRAEGDVVRRRVDREVADALDALRAALAQRAALAPHLGDEARLAVRAVQVAYAEGEITLVEWLDAIRAYLDAESTYVMLQAEVAVRRAALARAVGAPSDPPASPDR